MRTTLTLTMYLLLVAVSTHATPAAHLVLRPDTILTGTSSDAIVSIQNDTSETMRLSPFIKFNTVDPLGQSFVASRDHTMSESDRKSVPDVFLHGDSHITIPPRSSVTVSIPFSWPSSPFRDARFTATGRYEITATMETSAGALLVAEPVTLFVTAPDGDDAAVWQRIVEICGAGCAWGYWQSFGLRETVLAEYPESTYALYAAGYDFRDEPDASRLRAIALAGPYRDKVLLFEADTVAGEVLMEAILNRDHAAALRAASGKRKLLEQIVGSTLDPYIRAEASAAIAEIPSSSELAENIRELATSDRQGGKKIIPKVNCVESTPNGWIAWFGYENPYAYDVWLGSSTGKNKFEPKPHERGQPETFKKGGESRAFAVPFDGTPITWFVRGEKAVATGDFPLRCTE